VGFLLRVRAGITLWLPGGDQSGYNFISVTQGYRHPNYRTAIPAIKRRGI